MVVVFPVHVANQWRLRCLIGRGESQDAFSVGSVTLDLLRFPLPCHLPDKPLRVRERDGDRRS